NLSPESFEIPRQSVGCGLLTTPRDQRLRNRFTCEPPEEARALGSVIPRVPRKPPDAYRRTHHSTARRFGIASRTVLYTSSSAFCDGLSASASMAWRSSSAHPSARLRVSHRRLWAKSPLLKICTSKP